jgi:hypothetical protein
MSRYTPTDRRNHRAGLVQRGRKAPKTTADRAHELMRQNHWLGRNTAQAQAEQEQRAADERA